MSGAERHQWAVAQTLGFAQEAAARGDFKGALQWLEVVEVVDGVLPVEWQRTPFTESDEETVVLLARFAGVAIDHARRYSSLEAQHTELRRTVDALHATVEPEVQRGALRRAIECQ